MLSWIATDIGAIVMIALSVIGIYVALVALTRLSGLRSFSKMSSFDFAVTVAVGSVVASVIVAKTPPLAQAVAALAFLFALQMGVAAWRVRSAGLAELIDNKPRLIMAGPTMLPDAMKTAKITENDLRAKLREANVLDLAQVEAVVAETTGDISVLHRQEGGPRLDRKLLEGVIGVEALEDV